MCLDCLIQSKMSWSLDVLTGNPCKLSFCLQVTFVRCLIAQFKTFLIVWFTTNGYFDLLIPFWFWLQMVLAGLTMMPNQTIHYMISFIPFSSPPLILSMNHACQNISWFAHTVGNEDVQNELLVYNLYNNYYDDQQSKEKQQKALVLLIWQFCMYVVLAPTDWAEILGVERLFLQFEWQILNPVCFKSINTIISLILNCCVYHCTCG